MQFSFPARGVGCRAGSCRPVKVVCSCTLQTRPSGGRLNRQISDSTKSTTLLQPVLPAAQQAARLAPGLALFLSQCPAVLAQTDFTPAYDPKSYYVSLGLFVLTLPGLWSLIKRSPQSKLERKTYEVDGPKKAGAPSLTDRAKEIFRYFKKYNYEMKDAGEVVTFVGTYAADRGQASALVFYTFCSLAATALVLSITSPEIGNWWYLMTLASPAAGAYYWQRATRQEEAKVKMVTSDDGMTTEVIVEGDREELDRLAKELGFMEKGKVYVKGVLENFGSM